MEDTRTFFILVHHALANQLGAFRVDVPCNHHVQQPHTAMHVGEGHSLLLIALAHDGLVDAECLFKVVDGGHLQPTEGLDVRDTTQMLNPFWRERVDPSIKGLVSLGLEGPCRAIKLDRAEKVRQVRTQLGHFHLHRLLSLAVAVTRAPALVANMLVHGRHVPLAEISRDNAVTHSQPEPMQLRAVQQLLGIIDPEQEVGQTLHIISVQQMIGHLVATAR
mmetsp:Transcript_46551/g.99280  ORF Transcript_46551/g.99280 Transcript_46551/m.99280 type:complete len:220 (+) Transcript_46551:1444-2103(+)